MVQARACGGGANWATGEKAAVTQGTGNGAHRLGSGSVKARAWRPWEHQAAAMTARAGWAGLGYERNRAWLGEGEEKVNLKEPSPLLFIKVLSSRTVISLL